MIYFLLISGRGKNIFIIIYCFFYLLLFSFKLVDAQRIDTPSLSPDRFVKACEKENADEFRRAVKKKTSERYATRQP